MKVSLRVRRSGAVFALAVGIGVGGTTAATAATPSASHCYAFRPLVIISTRTGAANCDFPDLGLNSNDTNINSVISDRHGGWFVSYGASGVTRLRSNGTPYASWHAQRPPRHPELYDNAGVVALHLLGNTLYVGGGFGVEALDASTGRRLWLTPVTSNQTLGGYLAGVIAIAANSGGVYVVGGFTAVNGTPGHSLFAVLDPHTGDVLPTRVPAAFQMPYKEGAALNGVILDGNTVFVSSSGPFVVDGQSRDEVAALDARTGKLLPWKQEKAVRGNQPFNETNGLFFADGDLFGVGGGENATGGAVSASIGRIVPGPWMYADAYAAHGNLVYIGGFAPGGFNKINGHPRNDLAAFDVKSGRLTAWSPSFNVYQYVHVMAVSGDQILAAGDFDHTLG